MQRFWSRMARVTWLALAPALLSLGCAVSKESFKGNFQYEPTRASATIEGNVLLETSHTLSAGVVATFKQYGNTQGNIDRWREAVAEAAREDMLRSGLLKTVPDGSAPNLILKVETSETDTPESRLTVVLSVLDPATRVVIGNYERSAALGTSIFAYSENMRKGLATGLAEIREELLRDYQAGKIRSVITTARASKASQTHLAAARTAQTQGHYAAALAAMRQALAADSAAVPTVAAAVELLQALCDPEGARKLGEEARKAHPNDAGLEAALAGTGITPHAPACQAQQWNRDAIALARSGQRADALAKLTEARTLAPGLVPKASYNAAILLEQSGKPQEAVAAYLEAYRGFLMPADQQEALTRLVACAQRANLAPPEGADRRYRLGIVRAQQKRYPEAVTEFEAALAQAPWLVDAYYNLGLVYDFTNAPAPAVQALRTYLTLAPQSPHVSAVKTKIVELEDKMGLVK